MFIHGKIQNNGSGPLSNYMRYNTVAARNRRCDAAVQVDGPAVARLFAHVVTGPDLLNLMAEVGRDPAEAYPNAPPSCFERIQPLTDTNRDARAHKILELCAPAQGPFRPGGVGRVRRLRRFESARRVTRVFGANERSDALVQRSLVGLAVIEAVVEEQRRIGSPASAARSRSQQSPVKTHERETDPLPGFRPQRRGARVGDARRRHA